MTTLNWRGSGAGTLISTLWRCGAKGWSVRRRIHVDSADNFFRLLLSPPRNCLFLILPKVVVAGYPLLLSMPISASPCPNPAALAGWWTCRRCAPLTRPFVPPVWHLSIGSPQRTQARAFVGITRHEVGDRVKVPVSHRLKVGHARLRKRS